MTPPLSPPAAVRVAASLATTALVAVRPEQLTAPTPCGDFDVRALLDHLGWAALLSQRSATGLPLERDRSSLRPAPFLDGLPAEEWAGALPVELDTAADAWADPAAWEGETVFGTAPMPAGVVGPLMLAEFVLHGWDLARAVGAPYDVPAGLGKAVLAAIEPLAELGRDSGWYGPAVAVPTEAAAFDRALGLAGRDPGWRA
ncbi:TIGR03086 family metal-binding protein [Modestobacter marinus]|uniref:TIGR03086 family protein n=1 Tax=Modestobacter marinus TaxID=477641 RepID=A0A846LLS6_9ACTN|nr:TIGR03086 family metal-binding protein [Modestobacter marinus]NIH68351.1 uncharacterized protein (TIGR03086 family) [Modestobacter marinus]GGL56587.1 TIGR03086 family protein [Modestobacter marinus]